METVEIKKTTINKFCQGIEEVINELVEDVKILNWDEDHITRKLLSQLTTKLSGSLLSDMENKVVFFTPFKLRKGLEEKYGDIAIIVSIEYTDGDKIEGIAFLEAKKKYKDTGVYSAIKWDQLERINSNAPHSQLLLYDFRNISEFSSTGLVPKKSPTSTNPMIQLPVTKFVVIPTNKAIQVKVNNERLYKLSLPLSYQIGYRYLNGFDLDFGHKKLEQVKRDFAKNYEELILEVPEYLITVTITSEKNVKEDILAMEGKKQRIVYVPETDIDDDLYIKIKPKD